LKNHGTCRHVIDSDCARSGRPYGLHALGIAGLVLFLVFLGIFNVTTFF